MPGEKKGGQVVPKKRGSGKKYDDGIEKKKEVRFPKEPGCLPTSVRKQVESNGCKGGKGEEGVHYI